MYKENSSLFPGIKKNKKIKVYCWENITNKKPNLPLKNLLDV